MRLGIHFKIDAGADSSLLPFLFVKGEDKDIFPKPRRYFTGRSTIPLSDGTVVRKAQQFGSGMEFPLHRFLGDRER